MCKIKRGKSLIFSTLVVASFLFCTGTVFAATTVSGDITSDTTWTNQVYEVVGTVTVDTGVTLTIDPGAIVKFDAHNTLLVNGTLDAAGDSGSGVIFTSVKDDSVGGDTNGDGTSTAAATGDWGAIEVGANASTTLDHSIIRYGGNSGCCSFLTSDVYNNGGVLNIFNSEVASSTSYGIFNDSGTSTIDSSDIHGTSAYGIASQAGSLNVSSSTIHDDTYGIYAYGTGTLSVNGNTFFDHSGNPLFLDYSSGLTFSHDGNTASGTGDRGFAVTGSLAAGQTWSGDDGVPYEVSSLLTVPSGQTLTIDPGAIVKFDAHNTLLVNGTLDAAGDSGSGVIFTSVKDDSVGGDTNGDGTSTAAATGDWGAIEVGANASTTLDHSIIRYGGNSGCCSFLTSDVYNNGGVLNIFNSEVASSTSYGIFNDSGTSTVIGTEIHGNAYGYFYNGGDSASFSNNIIHDNYGDGMYNNTTATTSAQNNYWGGNQGPYNAIYNPTGNGDDISNYIDFLPYATTSVVTHYLLNDDSSSCPPSMSLPCASVRNNALLLDVSGTTYRAELSAATSTWNALSNIIDIATSTTPNVELDDIDRPDLPFKGGWSQNPTQPDPLELNSYFLDSDDFAHRQNTITHELGHALGLGHSYTGNVMYPIQSAQTALGPQDIADFNYLWH